MPVGYFFLGAEVTNDAWDALPSFVSSRDPARSLHDRLEMHFGTESALTVLLSAAVGTVSAGASIEDALRYLSDLVATAETFWGSRFTLDAETDEAFFWRDMFNRIEAVGLGISSGPSTPFGVFEWQRLDVGGTMDAEVDGDEAAFVGTGTDNTAEFIGYPTFKSGEILLRVYVPEFDIPTGWDLSIKPWRDDLTDMAVFVRLVRVGSNWRLWAGARLPTDDAFLNDTYGGDPWFWTSVFLPDWGWYNARFMLGALGEESAVKFWADGSTEPSYWESGNTMPSPYTGDRWVAVTWGSELASSETSPNSWAGHSVGAAGDIFDIVLGMVYTQDTWLAVGNNSKILYSTDGITWALYDAYSARRAAYALVDWWDVWIICDNTHLYTLWDDPATQVWTEQTHGLGSFIYGLGGGNGVFVIVGDDGKLSISTDGGDTWTAKTSTLPTDGSAWIQAVAYGNGVWVAVGGGWNGAADDVLVSTSSDNGETWTAHATGIADLYGNAVAYGGGLWVVVGDGGFVMTSDDNGVTWTQRDPGHTDGLNDVSYANGEWVAVGYAAAGPPWGPVIYTTSDPTGAWDAQDASAFTDEVRAVQGRETILGRPTPRMTVASTSDSAHRTLLLDYVKAKKTDTDPARIYHAFRLDGYVMVRYVSSLTLDAISRETRSGSVTLDAEVA